MARRRLARTVRLLSACLLTTLSLTVFTPAASAEVDEGIGHRTTPGQSWGGRDRDYDWLGSYVVGGEQVFCVSFALKAPDTDETYEPGDALLTKWGDPLPDDLAANISYLLLRYGDTTDPDEAAALAHLLHSWTAAPRTPADLDPDKPFTEIGYDVESHFEALPEGARTAVERLRTDAEANRGPWTATVAPPEGEQTIGTPASWTVAVTNAEGTGVPGVEITLTLADLALATENSDGVAEGSAGDTMITGDVAEGAAEVTVTTDENGVATVTASPVGAHPSVVATLSAPADRPYVRDPVTTDTQRVVSTGGEQELTAEAATTAKTPPGTVRVTKVDEATGEGIAGVPLRITAADGTSPALAQDDQPLLGEDGKPLVVTTEGTDGMLTVDDLRTPQKVCVIEVRPPNGYTDAFDPENPPSACGELRPGETLALRIANVADQVPRTIPAGERAAIVEQAAITSGAPVGALVGLGGLAVLASGLAGWAARKRYVRR